MHKQHVQRVQVLSQYSAHWLQVDRLAQLLLIKTADRVRKQVTELIAQWVLRGPFYFIAAGEWLPNHDELRYSVFRYTTAFDDALENLTLSRPFTCLQFLDLLMAADEQNKPILILDYLHLFYDADVDLALRYSTLDKCCHYTRSLSFTHLVAMIVPTLVADDYRRFFPFVASMATSIMEADRQTPAGPVQGSLF